MTSTTTRSDVALSHSALVAALIRLGKTKKPKRLPRALFPYNAERTYRAELVLLLKRMREIVDANLTEAALRSILADGRQVHGIDSAHADAYDDDVKRIFQIVRREAARVVTARGSGIAKRAADETAATNKREQNKTFRAVFGVDVIGAEPYLERMAKAFVADNVALIESIPEEYFKQLERAVMNAARQGRRPEALAKEIEARYDVSESKAKLIARDQIAKFNGSLTRVRQTKLGIDRYVWRTSLDERVRSSHEKKEGKVFSWSKPPADTGHPGQDFQCRCSPEPVLDDILGEVTAEPEPVIGQPPQEPIAEPLAQEPIGKAQEPTSKEQRLVAPPPSRDSDIARDAVRAALNSGVSPKDVFRTIWGNTTDPNQKAMAVVADALQGHYDAGVKPFEIIAQHGGSVLLDETVDVPVALIDILKGGHNMFAPSIGKTIDGDDVRRALLLNYHLAQEILKAEGKETVTLYRGIVGKQAEQIKEQMASGDVAVTVRSFSSFSEERWIAGRFAHRATGDDEYGVVLRIKVPAERVAMVMRFGKEKECVLLDDGKGLKIRAKDIKLVRDRGKMVE